MLRPGRRTVLALEAVLDIAYHARPDPVQARDITARQGIPHRRLEQILQRLVRAGILTGVRGPRGGYVLARERQDISLGEIVRIVQAMEDEPPPGPATPLGRAGLAPVLADIEAGALARLDAVTLEDLCREAEALGIPRAGESAPELSH